MNKINLIIYILVIFATSLLTLNAQNSENVKAALISSTDAIYPNQTFWIAVEFEMFNNWHIYWRNSGDSGLPTTVEWQVPEGFKVSKTYYPYPDILVEENSATFIYEDKVLLFAEITSPNKIDDDSILIKANADWLECKQACLPGSDQLSLSLKVVSNEEENIAEMFYWKDDLKKNPINESDWELSSTLKDSKVIIKGIKPDWFEESEYKVFFFPYDDLTYNHSSDQKLEINKNGFELTLELNSFRPKDPSKLSGILVISESWEKDDKRKSIEINTIIKN